jgi:hypothetical protein
MCALYGPLRIAVSFVCSNSATPCRFARARAAYVVPAQHDYDIILLILRRHVIHNNCMYNNITRYYYRYSLLRKAADRFSRSRQRL